MFFPKIRNFFVKKTIGNYFRSIEFQRVLIATVTVLLAFVIVLNGALPKKYKLSLGDKSPYDITAPRDIENKVKTENNRQAAANAVQAEMKEISAVPIEVLNNVNSLMTAVETARASVEKSLRSQGISPRSSNYKKQLETEEAIAANTLDSEVKKLLIPLSSEQVKYLVSKASDEDIAGFKKTVMELVSQAMKEDITAENISSKTDKLADQFQASDLNQELKNIGVLLAKAVLKPNRTIDEEATRLKRQKAYNDEANIEIIAKDSRIISFGDTVTEDKLKVLEELNLLEKKGRFDFAFAAGILLVIVLLALLLILYMHNFCKRLLYSRGDLILLSVIILLTLLIARGVSAYSPLAIPVFMAAMLISILLDLKLALAVNILLTIAITFITRGDMRFMYMALISGAFSAFLVAKANQRGRLSMAGIIVGLINILVIACIGIINRNAIREIAADGLVVFVNGLVSIVLTIGMLPFFETTFNVITQLKLLELANPNQPLLKRLLMEAPGTYHHSLMVGNLAEVATEAIGGNALLARVGAYFHDIGKIKRPSFFKENQLSDNPHDRMTANLSTLVITSHTRDGVELAEKYKIPLAVRNIISQHHGTTLVAYFYHKAKKGEKGEEVKQENFRYEGPKPSTKEAAVVMLADSVEAAVRSMVDKTEGKIEGLVRKLIKDKLDDGQLDMCDLTLKDLDEIAKGFMRVFSGFFHEREEYPEIKEKMKEYEEAKEEVPAEEVSQQKVEE
ncbi:MAG: HDIG domain-containing protein [Clostridiales bacterium]|jgi:putative nucleotidyltransferase with HDIG domain|nr:HDIG domain-containing protein [Eubacteriales bacterium]MDH7565335.1 HDIG domain-containing protein [Clostridiales bacterium]